MQEAVLRPRIRPWLRPLFFALGMVFVGIGIVGVFLPLIPTTEPLLLAAFFFARSSQRMHDWLLNHPRFGKFIRDFQAGRGIPMRTKVIAVVAMSATFTYTIVWVLPNLAWRLVTGLVWVWGLWYVLHLPTSNRGD